MKTSESIAALSASLAKAQGEMSHALKDRTNPHFKADYATLASVIDAARVPLSRHQLCVVQGLAGGPAGLVVTTRLAHESGEWIEDELTVPLGKSDAQGIGSAATYGRRYAYAAMVGIAQVDDDGESAAQTPPTPDKIEASAPPSQEELDFLQGLRDAALNGMPALEAAWKALPSPVKRALRGELDSLKKAAAAAAAEAKAA
jgi:hypothetical protein